MKPKLLDLCCKAGGASKGYSDAGFDVYGVDIEHQPNYVHPGKFIKADAIAYLKKYGHLFDVIAASPPCQEHSRTKSLHTNSYPDIIAPLRDELRKTGKPYVMENVVGAPLINPVMLDGTMFNLRVIRKRLFESNISLLQPSPGIKMGTVGGKNFTRKTAGFYYIVGGHQSGTLVEWREAMQITWMSKTELAQAIPPAYTKYIGEQLITYLDNQCNTLERKQTLELYNS
jgi:DNA (cytosine-5)-methyltransferase 1